MEKKFVITINRYCGSGGSTVGRKVAEKLGVNFYDKDLIDLASEESGISLSLFAQADERVKNSLFTRLSRNIYDGDLISPDSPDFTSYQNLFNYQAKVIKDLAEKESCVVVGRCADFILKDLPNRVSVFLTADDHDCVQNEMQRLSITNKQAKDRIVKINAYRKAYYRHHTGLRWNSAKHYDLSLNTSRLSYDECAEIIVEYLNRVLAKNEA